MLVSSLDKLHAKHVLPGFTDRTAEEREIERQTTEITKVSLGRSFFHILGLRLRRHTGEWPGDRQFIVTGQELTFQDFRRCTALIGNIQPSRQAPRAEITTAKNVQRGLAQKVQDVSAQFRKKQRVYMQSECETDLRFGPLIAAMVIGMARDRAFTMCGATRLNAENIELQGHAIKNKDLLAASGAITLKGSDVLDELQEDERAVSTHLSCQSTSTTIKRAVVGRRQDER